MQDTISKTKMTEGTTRHKEGHRAFTGSTKKKNREQRTASVGGKAKSCTRPRPKIFRRVPRSQRSTDLMHDGELGLGLHPPADD